MRGVALSEELFLRLARRMSQGWTGLIAFRTRDLYG